MFSSKIRKFADIITCRGNATASEMHGENGTASGGYCVQR